MNILAILGKIGFDWHMALANLANFLIIFWLLKKYAWPSIQRIMDERQHKIDQGLEDAKKAAGDLIMAEENYKNRMNTAKKEANLIIAKASEEGREIIDKITKEAEIKTGKLMDEARELINKEKEKMLRETRQEIITTGIMIAEKIIKVRLDKSQDTQLIKKVISEN